MAIWDDVLDEQDRQMFEKARMGGKALQGSKPALVIVDMTYGFVDSRFRLGHSETGYPAVQATARLLEAARRVKLPVFYTRGVTESSASGTGLWKGGEAKSVEENTVVHEIAPLPEEVVIEKRRPSGFFGTNLVDMLIFHGIDSLIVTGLTTSGCVRATVVDAFSYNYRVVVPQECVADRSQISHKVGLMDMNMKYANVQPLADVLAWLEENP
ncbi:isochorismatase family protein [Pusillimonas noertemannii]|uniref:Nicotinamidase-related amidase n=1 Tax=Pusillimonas noertemannii TaxID=305977 RepID=A0A2U1CQ18_9BURK|nr:isochorismatase family protein [Pusillimonas noertemannii]PVY67978.1 nicotinamidase-related amidase [Pusillimonas noertemannii]